MMWLALGIGAAIGLGSGILKAKSNSVELEEKKKELERKKQYLKNEYEDSKDYLNNSANRAIDNLNANIQDTTNMRDRAAGIAGRQIVDQQVLNDMQIAQLQVQSAEAQGSALQDVAMSGTRRMIGTGEDQVGKVVNAGVYATREKAGASLALARTQAKIQTRQSLESASYSYTNANMQIRSYQRQIENTRGELADRLKQLQTSYDDQVAELDYNLTYMDSDEFKRLQGWSTAFDILGSTFNGMTSALDFYGTGRQYNWGRKST